jgi:hypothetical protein
MAVTLNASTTTGLVQSADLSGSLNIQSNGTTVLGVTSTGIAVTGTHSVTGTQSVGGNLSFNSGYGSSAVAYGCRAWVNFDGTGTPAIRASGNVSSITDNSTGDYTVNFTNALTDTNYSICGTAGANPSFFAQVLSPYPYSTQTTSAMRFRVFGSASTLSDVDLLSIAIFR